MDVSSLKKKIQNKEAVIGIAGLGYVGLPLVIRFAEVGFRVLGIDIDKSKVDELNIGNSFIEHIPSSDIKNSIKAGFRATTDFAEGAECDAILICVPTPLDKHRNPDLQYVEKTAELIAPHLRAGQIISLESTTYPGTTDELMTPILEKNGLKAGKDFYVVYSPEREDPGNPNFKTQTIPKVCGGLTEDCRVLGTTLYEQVIDKVVVMSSTKAAEMTKLLENIHRAVNIGLVNEMKMVADKMDIDIFEVINAAATKPFGFTPYYPGPGLGGHCIPIDPFYLTWKAMEYGVNTRFIELAGEVNTSMPHYVVEKTADALNDREKSIKGSKILILGVAYKKNVDDMRETPAAEVMDALAEKGALLSYSDPHVQVFPRMRNYNFEMESTELTKESIAQFDCVVLVTDHEKFDYKLIAENAQLIIDSRGTFDRSAENVVRA